MYFVHCVHYHNYGLYIMQRQVHCFSWAAWLTKVIAWQTFHCPDEENNKLKYHYFHCYYCLELCGRSRNALRDPPLFNRLFLSQSVFIYFLKWRIWAIHVWFTYEHVHDSKIMAFVCWDYASLVFIFIVQFSFNSNTQFSYIRHSWLIIFISNGMLDEYIHLSHLNVICNWDCRWS